MLQDWFEAPELLNADGLVFCGSLGSTILIASLPDVPLSTSVGIGSRGAVTVTVQTCGSGTSGVNVNPLGSRKLTGSFFVTHID